MVHELLLNEDVCAFDKGYYVGQEVINRIDVKGLINKRRPGSRSDGPHPRRRGLLGEQVVSLVTSATSAGGAGAGGSPEDRLDTGDGGQRTRRRWRGVRPSWDFRFRLSFRPHREAAVPVTSV